VSASSGCLLYKTCPELDESCGDCVSSERRCLDEESSSTTDGTTATTDASTTPAPKGKKLHRILYLKNCFQIL